MKGTVLKMEIKITKAPALKEKPYSSTLGFGRIFTDHMFMMDYSREEGWHSARIVPFGNISLHPASTVLHYGSEIFEGLKAYRRKDGKVFGFLNHALGRCRIRLNHSNNLICIYYISKSNIHKCCHFSPFHSYYRVYGNHLLNILNLFADFFNIRFQINTGI